MLRITVPGLGTSFVKFVSCIFFFFFCCEIVWVMVLGILLRDSVDLAPWTLVLILRSGWSWIFKVCSFVRSWGSYAFGYWILNIWLIVRSWRSWILLFWFLNWDSGDPRSWTLFCRENLEILDLDIIFCHQILRISDRDFWLWHMSGGKPKLPHSTPLDYTSLDYIFWHSSIGTVKAAPYVCGPTMICKFQAAQSLWSIMTINLQICLWGEVNLTRPGDLTFGDLGLKFSHNSRFY